MKIGIVGSPGGVSYIRSLLERREMFIEFIDYPCDVEYVAELLERVQPELDGILFTGNDPYSYARENAKNLIPWATATISDSATLRALLQASMSGVDMHRITYDLKAISVDQMAWLLSNGREEDERSLSIFRYDRTDDISVSSADFLEHASAYHEANLKSGRADYCLSATQSVVDKLCRLGYHAYMVLPAEETVCAAINELRLRCKMQAQQREFEQGEMAVLALSVRLSDSFAEGTREYQRLLCYQQIEVSVFEFAKKIGAALEKHEKDQFLIYTTSTELVRETERFTRMALLQKIQTDGNVKCAFAGVGLGSAPGMAKSNALAALSSARKREYSCYYILGEDGMISGPFDVEISKQERAYSEIRLSHISEETGVSMSVLHALSRAQLQYGFDTVTSAQLAKLCGMTTSNLNRIVVRLEEKGYIEIVGYRPNSGAGRPSRLLRLRWGMESL